MATARLVATQTKMTPRQSATTIAGDIVMFFSFRFQAFHKQVLPKINNAQMRQNTAFATMSQRENTGNAGWSVKKFTNGKSLIKFDLKY